MTTNGVPTTIATFESELAGARCATEEAILLDAFYPLMHEEITRHQGAYARFSETQRVVHFDDPIRAIHCALAVQGIAESQGVDLRIGLHAGEVQHNGNAIIGPPVDISAQIAALAEPGEILVTSTVTDLLAGSGFSFSDHGTQQFDHEIEQQQLFLVQS